MRIQSTIFGILFLLSLGWMCFGISITGSAFDRVVNDSGQSSAVGNLDSASAQTARTLGAGLGAGLSTSFFLCTGLPLSIVFGLLYWRNNVGIREKKKHEQLLELQRQQVTALQASAAAQYMQTETMRGNLVPDAGSNTLLSSVAQVDTVAIERLRQARSAVERGDLEGAKPLIAELYARMPDNPQVLYLVSFVADTKEKQIRALERALMLGQSFDEARRRLQQLGSSNDLL